ncbi:MAG: hypothetical protein EA428_01200 [Spirochaetaceae bacterium]|nr:MAG: hypothetical protein EA428_01200 [Spirochaetaceae bacterium]
MKLQRQTLKQPSFLHRMFGRPYRPNLLVELRNMIASHDIDGISADHVVGLETTYKCQVAKTALGDRKHLFQDVLNAYLGDQYLSERERTNLSWLREILGLPHDVAQQIREEAVASVFRSQAESAVSDGKLSMEQQEALTELADSIALPETMAAKIYSEVAGARIQRYLDGAIADQQLSPEQDEELRALARNLRVSATMDSATQRTLDRYRLFWQIENGEVPEIDADIHLFRGERCFFRCDAAWHELKQVTRRLNYGGPTMRIKIMKGVYWRAGSLGVQRVTEDVVKHLDDGVLFLTNKRILFMGRRRNKNIRLNRILDFEIYSNGVQIEKDAGASPFLETSADMELFGLLLGRAIRDLM